MLALDAARSAGAQYADVRISRNRVQSINTRERRVQGLSDNETFGFGVRTLVNGAWGFAASSDLTRDEVARVARQAAAQAKANRAALVQPGRARARTRHERRHVAQPGEDRSVRHADRREGRAAALGERSGAQGAGIALRELRDVLPARREDATRTAKARSPCRRSIARRRR